MKKGFLARLFGRRRGKDDFQPTIPHALAATARSALARVFGREIPMQAAVVTLEELLEQVSVRSPGWLAAWFTDCDAPELVMVIPDSWSAGVTPPPAVHPEKGLPAAITAVCANAADFLRFDDPPSGFHRYFRRYGSGDIPLLEWRLSGMRALRLVAGDTDGPSFFACVREETALAFEESLREDRRKQEALRTFLSLRREPGAAETPSLPGSRLLRLRASRELVLGGLFLPARVECGAQVAEVMCTDLAAAPDRSLLDAPGVWAAAACDAAATEPRTRLALWYFFPAADAERAGKAHDTFRGLAGCLFRAAMPPLSQALGIRLENPGLTMDAKPDLGRSGFLGIQARMRVAGAHVRVDAFVESATLATLLRRHCNPVALAATTGASRSALSLALALNEEMLGKSLESFTRSFLDARMGADFFPFSAFADLVTDRDLALIMQNHLPRGLGGKPLRRLVAWSAEGRMVTPLLFDEERLRSFLPPQGRDAWERVSAEELGSREDYLALNREVLAGIARASQRETLLLSPRARAILSRLALPGIAERSRQKLRDAVAAGVPFAALHRMSRPQVQRLFASQSDRALCLALIGSESELAFVRANVSSARRARLEEDLPHARKLFSEGTIDPEEALQARSAVETAARKLLEEQAARGKKGGPR